MLTQNQTLTYEFENISGRFSKPFTFLLIISPILSSYLIGKINLGIICLLIDSLFIIFFERKLKMKWPKFFWLFFVFLILTRVLNANDYSFSSMLSFGLISFGILLGFSGRYFDLKYGIKLYEICVFFCIIFFFIQELMFFIIDSRIVGLLPLLPLDIYGNESYSSTILRLSYAPRSASFFTEPSYFSEYLLPLLALEMFKTKAKSRINFYVILISIVLLLLQSGLGLLLMALMWIIWIFYNLKNSSLYYKIIIVFILIPLASIGTYYFIKSEIGGNVLERTEEFDEVSSTTSTYVRIIRGYDLYAQFPIFNKVFGMNSNHKINTTISNSYMYRLFQEDDLSFNVIQSILIGGGIVGILLFSLHFFYLFTMNEMEGRMIGVMFIGLSFIAAIFLKHTMLLCYAIMYAYHIQYLNSIKA